MNFKEWNKKYRYLSNEFNERSFEERCKISRMIHSNEILELVRAKESMKTEGTNYFNTRIKQIEKGIADSENKLEQLKTK